MLERDKTSPIETAGDMGRATNDNVPRDENGADGPSSVQGQTDLPNHPHLEEKEQGETGPEHLGDDHDEPGYTLPDDLYSIFYPRWALADTPLAKAYRALYDNVVLTIQPQNLFDEMVAAEITEDFWRSREIANSVDNIIKTARRDALVIILAPMARHEYHVAMEWADHYFSGDPDKRKSIEDLLRSHGIGLEAITAQAIMQRTPVLQLLNRITSSNGIHREDILAALEKRREGRKGKTNRHRKAA